MKHSSHHWDNDGALVRHTFFDSDGMAYGELLQPGRMQILERNAELRKNPGALNNLESMGLELTIPEVDYYILIQKYPDLKSTDATARRLAWAKFMGSSESDPYRVRPRVLRAIPSEHNEQIIPQCGQPAPPGIAAPANMEPS